MTPRQLLSGLALLGPGLVGSIFLFAGLAKALEPENFVRHLKRLRLIPSPLLAPAMLGLAAAQCGLGTALVLAVWPRWVLPATIALLLGLAGVGFWSTATGRTEDCGCYNDVLTFSPRQSLLLDAAFVALLACAWWWGAPSSPPAPWKLGLVLATLLAAGALAGALFRYTAVHHRPLFDLSPLKVGRRWNPDWLAGEAGRRAASGEKLVVFLRVDCQHCKSWLKVLNTAHARSGLPEIVGAVVASPEELEAYRDRYAVRFPIVPIEPWVLSRLMRGSTPTAVLVQDGILREKWRGSMPKTFTERIRAGLHA